MSKVSKIIQPLCSYAYTNVLSEMSDSSSCWIVSRFEAQVKL